jgi:hypothetical protein
MRTLVSSIGAWMRNPYGVMLFVTVIWHGTLWALNINFNWISSGVLLVFDLLAAYILVDRLIYFFSQFVLPIQNPGDRAEIHRRVRGFGVGNRGPAIFIKNGRVIEHPGEKEKRGAGVILLDTASAAVLRTDIEFKDTIGPGVKFTKVHESNGKIFSEYVANSVDLRTQWQFIGPRAEAYAAAHAANRKSADAHKQTTGLTRDGIEVSPTLSIKFRIQHPGTLTPTESGVTSYYGYNPDAVRNAITREVVQLDPLQNKRTRLEWHGFPEHLVVGIWREYVRKFRLEDLFSGREKCGLRLIEEMINQRVRQAHVEQVDDTGEVIKGSSVPSHEFEQLNEHGLEVIEVRIHDVYFDPAEEDKYFSRWSSEWIREAKKDEAMLNEREALLKTNAREEAVKRFARIVTRKFLNPLASHKDPYSILQDLIQPLRKTLLAESSADRRMEQELRKLDEIWKWLLVNKFIHDNQSEQDKRDDASRPAR